MLKVTSNKNRNSIIGAAFVGLCIILASIVGIFWAKSRRDEWISRSFRQELGSPYSIATSSSSDTDGTAINNENMAANEVFLEDGNNNNNNGSGPFAGVGGVSMSSNQSPARISGDIGVVYAPRGYLGLIVGNGNEVIR